MSINSKLTRDLITLEELVIEFVLPEKAKAQYKMGDVAHKELEPFVSELQKLSSKYVQSAQISLSSQQLRAYALYYLPINFSKIAFLLNQGLEFGASKPIKILDYGCGPGTASLAACAVFPQALQITLQDNSSDCLRFAEKVIKSFRPDAQINVDPSLQDFDLIIAANVLTELSASERQATLDSLINKLGDSGYLVILEPALKAVAQLLMKDRDQILEKHKNLAVIFPCTRQGSCPMRSSDDWCHGELDNASWNRSNLFQQFDKLLEFNKHRIKYSPLVLSKNIDKVVYGYRILRPLTKEHRALVCGELGLLQLGKTKDVEVRRLLKKGSSYQLLPSEFIP